MYKKNYDEILFALEAYKERLGGNENTYVRVF